MISLQFIRFLLVGVINTCVGLGIIYACKYFAGMGDVLANAIGYCVGLTVSFTLNSRWTFNYSGSILPAVFRFFGVFLVAYVANLAVVMLLINAFSINGYIAQALGVPAYTLTFYMGSKMLVFRKEAQV